MKLQIAYYEAMSPPFFAFSLAKSKERREGREISSSPLSF
jgi:hypothetical protein